MKTTIWVNRDHEDFWIALPNKSGWVNMIIETLLEEQKRRNKLEEKYNEKNEE